MKLKVKTIDGQKLPEYAHEGDAGMDLRISENILVQPGGYGTVGTGVCVEIPEGCVGLVFPRSGLASSRGITLINAVGVIDSGYRGEVMLPIVNLGKAQAALEKGERIAQLVIVRFERCEVEQVEELEESERGTDGLGSTGTK